MKLKLNEGKFFWGALIGLVLWLILGCFYLIFWLASPLWLLTMLKVEK